MSHKKKHEEEISNEVFSNTKRRLWTGQQDGDKR